MINSDITSNFGWIKSVKKGLKRIPTLGWQYTSSGWQNDKTLKFKGGCTYIILYYLYNYLLHELRLLLSLNHNDLKLWRGCKEATGQDRTF